VVQPSSGSRLPGVEGLRALAACSVLVYHAWLFSAPDGQRVQVWGLAQVLPDLAFGVVLFTLSGFLLYRPFVSAILREKPMPSALRYLRNRALRIAPAYLVILLVVSLLLDSALSRDASGSLHTGRLTDLGLLVRNIFLVQNYEPSYLITGIAPAWSLAVEVVFYVALPGLALLGWMLARTASTRRGRTVAMLAPTFLLLAVGVSGKLCIAHAVDPGLTHGWNPDWESVLERSFLCQADLFVFGMALAVLSVEAEDGRLGVARGLRMAAAPLALVAYLITAKMTGDWDQLGYSFYNTLMAFAFACLLALVVLPTRRTTPSLLVRVLETRPVVWVGLISYSVFLWHEPLVRWLQGHGYTTAGAMGLATNTALLLAVTLVLSTITYRWVELPALRRKSGVRRERAVVDVPAEQVEAAP
jgi:peptidoglycan/LPS O-acetylase OafA/YrhL